MLNIQAFSIQPYSVLLLLQTYIVYIIVKLATFISPKTAANVKQITLYKRL